MKKKEKEEDLKRATGANLLKPITDYKNVKPKQTKSVIQSREVLY